MLQIIYNKIQGSKLPKLNNDCPASKLVHRGLATVLLFALMHSLFLMYHGALIMCGESDAAHRQEYINTICWTLGIFLITNHCVFKYEVI